MLPGNQVSYEFESSTISGNFFSEDGHVRPKLRITTHREVVLVSIETLALA